MIIPQFVSSNSPFKPAVSKSPHGIAMKTPSPTWIGIIPTGFVTCESGPHKSQIKDGANDGVSDGSPVEGDADGTNDGQTDGSSVGLELGTKLGCDDGCKDGLTVGPCDGCDDGPKLGLCDGGCDGDDDGFIEGLTDGLEVGESDGEMVGLAEGFRLGSSGGVGATEGTAVVGTGVVTATGLGVVTGPVPAHRQIQRKTEPCSGRVTPQKQQRELNPPPNDDGGTADGATGEIGAGVGAGGVTGVGPGPGPDDPGCRHVHVAEPPVGGGSAPQIHVGKPEVCNARLISRLLILFFVFDSAAAAAPS